MKYSQKQVAAVKKAGSQQVIKFNMKELNDFVNKQGVTAPPALVDHVRNLPARIARIRLMTYEAFNERFPSRIMPESFGAMLDGKDPKTGFPILYFYSPELVEKAQSLEVKKKKTGNLLRIFGFLASIYGNSFENDKALEDFILDTLPADIPYNLVVDGSRTRVAKLVQKEGAKLHGSSEASIFAVEHVFADQPTLTICHPQIDYVAEFAKKLNKLLEIGDKLAMNISKALPHDAYYSIQRNVETDFDKFVTKMARLLKVEEGNTVHDYAQNEEIEVVIGAHSRELALDLDDELPAAILVGNKLNLFVPD